MKNLRMAAIALVVLAVFALACGGSDSGGDSNIPVHGSGSAEVRLTNNTGDSIWYVYISPTSNPYWGDDLLGSSTIANGETHIFRMEPGDYDMRAEGEGNSLIAEEWGVSVSGTYNWTVQ